MVTPHDPHICIYIYICIVSSSLLPLLLLAVVLELVVLYYDYVLLLLYNYMEALGMGPRCCG